MIHARDVSVLRRGRALLADVSVDVRPGSFTALVGPNGAGKTTLMRLLSGDLAPDRGDVSLHGRSLKQWAASDLARVRAVLPQQSDLAFGFTPLEVVALGRLPHGESQPTSRRIAAAALEEVGMAEHAERSWLTLSGGERQRVQLARVLAQLHGVDDGLLFLDEPTNHLDLTHQVATLRTVRERVDRGLTAVAVLHDLTLASRVADHVVLLQEGRMRASGAPEQVLTPERLQAVYGVVIDALADGRGGHVLVPR